MKKIMILISLVFSLPAFAGYTYVIDAYQMLPNLSGTESMLITGQGGGGLTYLSDNSSLTIENTSTLGQGTGGVWEIHPGYNSSLYMSGGQVHEIAIINDATAFLSGGLIQRIWSQQIAWKYAGDPPALVPNPHIEIICENYNYNTATKLLTGIWGNNSLFNIQLVNVSGYSPAIDNIKFTLIPEPTSLLLLAVGGLLLKRR